MFHYWPSIRTPALACAVGLFAGACGFDGVDAAPARSQPAPTTTSMTTTTTSTTPPPQMATTTTSTSTTAPPATTVPTTSVIAASKPSPGDIVAFLGDSFTRELAECVAFGAEDATAMASTRAYIECDRDSFLASMVQGMAEAEPTLISQVFGISEDEAAEFVDCLTREVSLLSTDQLLFVADGTTSVIEFGTQIGELVSLPCSALFVGALALDGAPLVDGAVRAIVMDNDDCRY